VVAVLKYIIQGGCIEYVYPHDSINALIYLQELKDKDALLKQQRELLQVAHEQKVSEGFCIKCT
jgi:hypothetical protein